MAERNDAGTTDIDVEDNLNLEVRETQRAMREEREIPMPDENRPIDPNAATTGSDDEPGGQVRSNSQ